MKDEVRKENGRDMKSNKDKSRNRSPRRERSRSPVDRRNKDQSNKAQRRVYVANISFDTHWSEVKDLFRDKIGNVTYCTLFENEEGKSRGCGLVEFSDVASANKAIKELARYNFKGRELVVKEDIDCERDRFGRLITNSRKEKDNRSSQQRDGDRHNRSIYDPMRQTYLNSYNTYGLSPQFLDSLNISGPLNNRIFVANLDYKVGEKKLEEIFRLAGKVLRVRLYTDQTGTSKGFGTVEFEHPVEAVQAISMFNNVNLYGRAMSIRMDKYEIEEMPEVLPSKLPNGLETIGKGLGIGGQPLNISKSLNSQAVCTTPNPTPQPSLMGNVQNTTLPTGLGQNQGLSAPASQSQVNSSFNIPGLSNSSLSQQVGLNPSALSSPQVNQALNSAANLSSLNLSGLNTSSLSGLGNAQNLSQLSNAQNMNNLLAGLAGNPSSLNTSLGFNSASSASQNNLYGAYDQRDYQQQDRFRNGGLLNQLGNSNQQQGTDKVFIRNLPHSYNWQNLKDRFSEIGEVKYTDIKKNGLATVCFAQPRDAMRAVDLMNGLRIENKVIEVGFF